MKGGQGEERRRVPDVIFGAVGARGGVLGDSLDAYYPSGRIASGTMTEGDALVVVRTSRHGEAQILRSLLEDQGIPAALSYESAGIVYGLTIDGLGEVRILVPESYYAQAQAVLAISEGDDDGDPDDSP